MVAGITTPPLPVEVMVHERARSPYFVTHSGTPVIIPVSTWQVSAAYPAAAIIIVIATCTYIIVSFNFG
jgi:hypothetical protein